MKNSEKRQRSGSGRKDSDMQNVGLAITIPAVLAASVVVGGLLGSAADNWLGISPWGKLVGIFLGFATGVREMLRLLRRINKEISRSEGKKKP